MTLFDQTVLTSSAVISDCGTYRYRLTRNWSNERDACFIMLNPSTADASRDDPTIRRCIAFAKSWGCGGIVVVNLFALRATDPAQLVAASIDGIDPIGPQNDEQIQHALDRCHPVVCAWGAKGGFLERDQAVLAILKHQFIAYSCLGKTKGGHPRHPLYLRSEAVLVPFERRVARALGE